MKVYESLEEIEQDLRIYDLERKIAQEEAKAMGIQLTNGYVPSDFMRVLMRFAGRYGLMLALKKILR